MVMAVADDATLPGQSRRQELSAAETIPNALTNLSLVTGCDGSLPPLRLVNKVEVRP